MPETLIYRVGPQPGCSLKCLMPDLQSRTQPGRPIYVADVPNNREAPQAREPSKCLDGLSNGERLAKEAIWLPATRGLKKNPERAITPEADTGCVPAHLALPGSPQAKQLCHLHTRLSLGQSCHRQKTVLCLSTQDLFGYVQLFVTLWTVACQASPSTEFSRQENWSVLASTGCHTLPEHHLSCCPSHQLAWIPGASRSPATKAAESPPDLALTGVTEVLQGSFRSKPQWTTHMRRWK